MDRQIYQNYLNLLHQELVPALGCTEPIAVAYAGAVAATRLGKFPEQMDIACSANIIKNVKGVVVPNTGGEKGIEMAVVLGAVVGGPEKKLEVLASATAEQVRQAKALIQNGICRVDMLSGEEALRIIVTASAGEDQITVEISGGHTDITRITFNGQTVLENDPPDSSGERTNALDRLNLRDILSFTDSCDLGELRDLLDRVVEYNTRISREGLERNYGANVGRTMLKVYGQDLKTRAKAKTAAGSDARMSGCGLPVVINSGSGNQGLTVSLPVIEYADELGLSREKLYRALVLSNLVSIHVKRGIGKLSAFCGAVSAAAGSGAAITYMHGGNYEQIAGTIINTLASVSGIVCDGAKPSCAAKIASSVDAAILAHELSMSGQIFVSGDGLVKDDVEKTIQSIQYLAKEGMRETDHAVVRIMIDQLSELVQK